ncbi:hypothetical protein RRG08_027159 [Elysia crispata]|uniref:Uncharacterized protein n=1 Tax=Elysia crispata TaxID=231223 RepID=A0AAE1B509_9GAST|nr:hypothetical protein RRG08_027159 [Elysia crispata]
MMSVYVPVRGFNNSVRLEGNEVRSLLAHIHLQFPTYSLRITLFLLLLLLMICFLFLIVYLIQIAWSYFKTLTLKRSSACNDDNINSKTQNNLDKKLEFILKGWQTN